MATAATIKKNIAKLEAALKSKATPKTLKPKLEAQLVKSKAELSGIKKGTKPKTSSTKSTQTALQKLKEMVNKNKKYKTYKGAGVDLEKDADRPALRTGKRTAKKSGNTYYEYRANRIDVKQPSKTARYPKLEKGGYMADGGELGNWYKEGSDKWGLEKSDTYIKENDGKYELYLRTFDNKINKWYYYLSETFDSLEDAKKSGYGNSLYAKGGYMAKGGVSEKPIPAIMDKYGNVKSEKLLEQELEYLKEAYEDKLVTKDEYEKSYNEIKEQIKFLQSKEKGGYFAKGGYVAVSEKDGYWYIMSKPTTKEKAQEMINLGVPSGEVGKVVTLDEAKSHKKVIGEEYLEKGGYMAKGGGFNQYGEPYEFEEESDSVYEIHHKPKMNANNPYLIWDKIDGVYIAEFPNNQRALHFIENKKYGYAKGGALEHGLMVGDTVRDIAENSVAIYNVNNRKSYVVDLDKGTRTEWIGSFEKEMKYAKHGAYMAMGGEMHRTQE